ncbi:hypothetical protein Vadar_002193 [Vaccinium darrowii]|uniref:Uncharacterized protein n=1 Tax=Vaccinium darrowii TaxID=229202 RepID=A0ACB7Y4A9_9ERIC|nr:hypothetical protein Vadar_002193 [Vaccinium darrowii]
MSTGDHLNIHPSELKFPFEVKKQSSCSMQLTNKTDQYVAFKVKTTNPKKYCVRPNNGLVSPRSACNVTVTMQAQKEAPPDMHCKDKFLIQSVIAPNGATAKDMTPEMFNREDGKVIEEFKLRVIYIPANPPSPVPEGSEEGSSPRASVVEDGNQSASLSDAVTRSLVEPLEKSSSADAWSLMSKLTEEKAFAIQQNQKLCQELEMMRREISSSSSRGGGGFSVLFVALIGLIGTVMSSPMIWTLSSYRTGHRRFYGRGEFVEDTIYAIYSNTVTVIRPTCGSKPELRTKGEFERVALMSTSSGADPKFPQSMHSTDDENLDVSIITFEALQEMYMGSFPSGDETTFFRAKLIRSAQYVARSKGGACLGRNLLLRYCMISIFHHWHKIARIAC